MKRKATQRGLPYRCKHCGKTVFRESTKAWIKSYCEESGRDVHLTRAKNNAD